ncbi:SPARC [Biomphalaria pfeifferi]|uniref:SPARC n=1 Tax=Biomphalaria pfeifferi TaxID=112525 RepID=A0AAD8AQH3_BIOPF|nr:SPARC [Biomphalaria pfeifferi]
MVIVSWRMLVRVFCVLILSICSVQMFDQDLNPRTLAGLEKEWSRNPCFKKVCQRGETCVLDRDRNSKCVCQTDCGMLKFNRGQYEVCSTANVTYQSECHLNIDHCLCKSNARGCSQPGVTKILVDYFGACRDFPKCTDSDATQFPDRLRDWFYVVMDEMARRAAIGEYKDLWLETVKGHNHNYATIWKYCDLDVDPQDRRVSKRELQYLMKTVKATEQCLAPFLDKCDVNNDREITLMEWGHCLGLKDSEIVDKCHSIHQYRRQK